MWSAVYLPGIAQSLGHTVAHTQVDPGQVHSHIVPAQQEGVGTGSQAGLGEDLVHTQVGESHGLLEHL